MWQSGRWEAAGFATDEGQDMHQIHWDDSLQSTIHPGRGVGPAPELEPLATPVKLWGTCSSKMKGQQERIPLAVLSGPHAHRVAPVYEAFSKKGKRAAMRPLEGEEELLATAWFLLQYKPYAQKKPSASPEPLVDFLLARDAIELAIRAMAGGQQLSFVRSSHKKLGRKGVVTSGELGDAEGWGLHVPDTFLEALQRLRLLLAVATDEQYARAVACVRELWPVVPAFTQAPLAYLVPTEQDLYEELADAELRATDDVRERRRWLPQGLRDAKRAHAMANQHATYAWYANLMTLGGEEGIQLLAALLEGVKIHTTLRWLLEKTDHPTILGLLGVSAAAPKPKPKPKPPAGPIYWLGEAKPAHVVAPAARAPLTTGVTSAVQALGQVYWGRITALAFDGEGKVLVGGAWGLHRRDPDDLSLLAHQVVDHRVEALAVSGAGAIWLAVSRDGAWFVHALTANGSLGPALGSLPGDEDRKAEPRLAVSEDGSRVALGVADRVCVWHATGGEPLELLVPVEHEHRNDEVIDHLSLSPDGARLCTRRDSHAALWDLGTGQPRPIHDSGHYFFWPDGRLVGGASTIRDGQSLEAVQVAPCRHGIHSPWRVAAQPSADLFALSSGFGSWAVANIAERSVTQGQLEPRASSSRGMFSAMSLSASHLALWHPQAGRLVCLRLADQHQAVVDDYPAVLGCFAVSADGTRVLSSSDPLGLGRVATLASASARVIGLAPEKRREPRFIDGAFLEGERAVIISGPTLTAKAMRVVDLEALAVQQEAKLRKRASLGGVFPGGLVWLVADGRDQHGTPKGGGTLLYKAGRKAVLWKQNRATDLTYRAHLTADGAAFAVVWDKELSLYPMAGAKPAAPRSWEGHFRDLAAVSKHARYLARGQKRSITIHTDPLGEDSQRVVELPAAVTAMDWAPDGLLLVLALSDGQLALVEGGSAEILRLLPSGADRLEALRIAADGIWAADSHGVVRVFGAPAS